MPRMSAWEATGFPCSRPIRDITKGRWGAVVLEHSLAEGEAHKGFNAAAEVAHTCVWPY